MAQHEPVAFTLQGLDATRDLQIQKKIKIVKKLFHNRNRRYSAQMPYALKRRVVNSE